MKYDLVLFDLDGTLLDTLDDMTNAVAYALTSAGFPPRTREEVRTFVGNGIRRLLQRALPEEKQSDEEAVDGLVEPFFRYYEEHCMDFTRPFPGMTELTEELSRKKILCGVLSNKHDDLSNRICRRFFGDTLAVIRGKLPDVPRKPSPEGMLRLLSEMRVPVSRTLFVGDSEVDIRTAENAGADCVIVTWGYRGREALIAAGAERLADTAEELKRTIFSE